ncbi:hypothetical protein B8W69_26990 [Mycobacterium vulneris]|uniref:Uncharacterized protein n=1 Tax=Mycolicibacterium vulneris TaxID=547163 RepID=A0A1X2KK91_9MYCO|nr:hypothetical protein [Mycolicibacterium vulneris]OSC22102.1 hypothetical protein B8W69_26990 [Mycolicibacterium vulneris]
MWSKLDDKLHNHQKARKAATNGQGKPDLEPLGLWVVCLSYCGDQLTDGFVPAWYVATWVPGRKGVALADRLVAAGLWERAELDGEKGWQFHDFLALNPCREKVLADREASAKRQAAWRANKALEQAQGVSDAGG